MLAARENSSKGGQVVIKISYGSGKYGCRKTSAGWIYVCAQPGTAFYEAVIEKEEDARRWLSDRGLRKSKAKKLLDAGVRNEGPYADVNHPRRLDRAAWEAQTRGHGCEGTTSQLEGRGEPATR
jgi:hypothetical protein